MKNIINSLPFALIILFVALGFVAHIGWSMAYQVECINSSNLIP